VAAFVLFRILDAVKPWPIRIFDERVGGGFGVVIDDVIAGLVGCAMLHAARLMHGEWW
jgi:phosphatidylglycerophosphatase A